MGPTEWYITETKTKSFSHSKEGFSFLKIDCTVRVVNVLGYGRYLFLQPLPVIFDKNISWSRNNSFWAVIFIGYGRCLLLLLRICSAHLEILGFPMAGAYLYRDIFARFKTMGRQQNFGQLKTKINTFFLLALLTTLLAHKTVFLLTGSPPHHLGSDEEGPPILKLSFKVLSVNLLATIPWCEGNRP